MQIFPFPSQPFASVSQLDPTVLGHAMADRLMERGVFLPMILRVPDLAEILAITERAVRQQIAEGKIPAVKPGRDWLVPRDAWLRRLEEQAEASSSRLHRR